MVLLLYSTKCDIIGYMEFDLPAGHFRLEQREAAMLHEADNSFDRLQLAYPVSEAQLLLEGAQKARDRSWENPSSISPEVAVDEILILDAMVGALTEHIDLADAAYMIPGQAEDFLRSLPD